MFVCSLFQIMKHISTGLYVCELTFKYPLKRVTSKHVVSLAYLLEHFYKKLTL